MKKIILKMKKIENEWLLVISMLLILPTGAAVLMKRPLAWILELLLTVWLLFLSVIVIAKMKDK